MTGLTPFKVSLLADLSNVIPFAVCTNRKSACFARSGAACASADLTEASDPANAATATNRVRLVVIRSSLRSFCDLSGAASAWRRPRRRAAASCRHLSFFLKRPVMEAGSAIGFCLKSAASYSPLIYQELIPLCISLNEPSEAIGTIAITSREVLLVNANFPSWMVTNISSIRTKCIGALGQRPRPAVGAIERVISAKGRTRGGNADYENHSNPEPNVLPF